MSIITQMEAQVNGGATVAEAIEEIVPGADLVYWEFVLTGGKRQSRTNGSRTNGKPSKRTNYAEQALVWKLGPTCPKCGSSHVKNEEGGYNWCMGCGHRWGGGRQMTAIETQAAQATWEAANPADDYGVEGRTLTGIGYDYQPETNPEPTAPKGATHAGTHPSSGEVVWYRPHVSGHEYNTGDRWILSTRAMPEWTSPI